jgi:5-methyltetrahydropteroyltriglutamate--homocysteine methyltransferase
LTYCQSYYSATTQLYTAIHSYTQLLAKIADEDVEWLQIEEPILVQDLTVDWQQAFKTSYFGALGDNAELTFSLPIAGFHLDLSRGAEQLESALLLLPNNTILSAGIVNGRNIWRNDLAKSITYLQAAKAHLGDRLWIASSCSLQHSPVDLDNETKLDAELKSWFAYATQKLAEISIINAVLNGEASKDICTALSASTLAIKSRTHSQKKCTTTCCGSMRTRCTTSERVLSTHCQSAKSA